jgi:hypothetical protein
MEEVEETKYQHLGWPPAGGDAQLGYFGGPVLPTSGNRRKVGFQLSRIESRRMKR